jgi:HEPN domain-containing protein
MKRKDFHKLANMRLKEAKALLDQGHFAGAYYLAGYSVECALKACIAKRTERHDFPDKKITNESYTHNLNELLKAARLDTIFDTDALANDRLAENWTTIKDWSENARYRAIISESDARELYSAITRRTGGVLPWLKKRW